jgi:hypothetical protein
MLTDDEEKIILSYTLHLVRLYFDYLPQEYSTISDALYQILLFNILIEISGHVLPEV